VSRVASAFAKTLQDARRSAPGLRVGLKVGRASEFPGARDFAYCSSGPPIQITVAPKLEAQSEDRILGLLRHEFGHALMFHFAELKHNEREADRLAAHVFRAPVFYDAATVQTTSRSRAKYKIRPGFLPR
jgi:hypothetical protein